MNVTVTVDISQLEKSLQKTAAEAGVVTAVIKNDVPYVPNLEYGASKQAPHGMVRVSLREIGNVLAQAVQHEIDKESVLKEGKLRQGMVDAVNISADFGMGLIRDRTPIRTGRARRGWRVSEAV